MTDQGDLHIWETEEIDGGPVGSADFYVCKRCGASGGLTFWINWKRDPSGNRLVAESGPATPSPFLAGPAMPLPDTCTAAKVAIHAFILERLEQLRMAQRAEDAQALGLVLSRNSDRTDLTPMVRVVYEAGYSIRRYTLEQLLDQLRTAGFLT